MEPLRARPIPPLVPSAFIELRGDEPDPRRYGVAARTRTGPGLLWCVGQDGPCVSSPRVSVAVSALSFLQSAAKPQCVGNPALS
eukprot:3618401-Prymnesium_polylepis.1